MRCTRPRRCWPRWSHAAVLAALVAGCSPPSRPPVSGAREPGALRLGPSYQPRTLGRGPGFRPSPRGPAVAAARAVIGHDQRPLVCGRWGQQPRAAFGSHVEAFAGGHVIAIPAGIGVAPPLRRDGARVHSGRCAYPLRTLEPTGVVEVARGRARTLGDLFAIWGQPLSGRRLGAFEGPVRAYVNGQRRRGDVRSLVLARHAAIVLEVGPYVAPHPLYLFAPGL